MRPPDRPPLDPTVYEQIDMLMHTVDHRHWKMIAGWRVPNFFPPGTPLPPPSPLHVLNAMQVYASALLKAEADQYEQYRGHERYVHWLALLADRILRRVIRAVESIDRADDKATLLYHGVGQPQIEEAVRSILWELTHPYTGGIAGPIGQAGKAIVGPPPIKPKRLSSLIHSPSAAEKMQAYMNKKGLNQTEFGVQAGTSDKTIRKFIKTGMVKRSILIDIAAAMGVSKENLLS